MMYRSLPVQSWSLQRPERPISSLRLRLGRGDRRVPGRGRGRARTAVGRASGTGTARVPGTSRTGQRHRRVRLVPPLRRGHAADARARPRRVPLLDRVAENPSRRDRAREPGRPRPLRPHRRRAARERNRPVRDPLSLGSAAGAGGSGRLARARHGRGLRRVHGGRRRRGSAIASATGSRRTSRGWSRGSATGSACTLPAAPTSAPRSPRRTTCCWRTVGLRRSFAARRRARGSA